MSSFRILQGFNAVCDAIKLTIRSRVLYKCSVVLQCMQKPIIYPPSHNDHSYTVHMNTTSTLILQNMIVCFLPMKQCSCLFLTRLSKHVCFAYFVFKIISMFVFLSTFVLLDSKD